MTVKEALQLIEKNEGVFAVNYAIGYVEYALDLIRRGQLATCQYETRQIASNELKTQLLYILSNMTDWRQSKASTTTAAEIKECRAVLKKVSQI